MKHFLLLVSAVWLILAGSGVTPAYAAGPLHYEVQPGDTLFAIADYYGLNIDELAQANGLGVNGWLYPGQQLIIPTYTVPPVSEIPNPANGYGGSMELVPQPVRSTYSGSYTVQSGDTLYSLAQRYGATVADLLAANQLSDFGPPLYAGQQLIIPASVNAPAADSLLTRPALAAPPAWNTLGQGNPAPQPWLSYPNQPSNFYNSATSPFQPQPTTRTSPSGYQQWIDVDLTRQVLTAYEGQLPVFSSPVSSGIWQYPTVVGTFQIYVKYELADMSGGAGEDAYYLPNVPYVMYFHGNYGLHGTYWHSNFGQPMSHGCVNLPTPAAEWLFSWASLGTSVVTHY